jgi:hypothetical protein
VDHRWSCGQLLLPCAAPTLPTLRFPRTNLWPAKKIMWCFGWSDCYTSNTSFSVLSHLIGYFAIHIIYNDLAWFVVAEIGLWCLICWDCTYEILFLPSSVLFPSNCYWILLFHVFTTILFMDFGSPKTCYGSLYFI